MILRYIIFLLLLFACFGEAMASQSVHVEWGYTPPTEPAVTGYQLYQNGVAAMVWDGAATTEGDVTLSTLAIGDSFTLTALFADDTESPHSSPYIWTEGAIIHIKFATLRLGNSHGSTNKANSVRLQ